MAFSLKPYHPISQFWPEKLTRTLEQGLPYLVLSGSFMAADEKPDHGHAVLKISFLDKGY